MPGSQTSRRMSSNEWLSSRRQTGFAALDGRNLESLLSQYSTERLPNTHFIINEKNSNCAASVAGLR